MEHSFDINIAKEYGIEEAIFIKHFYFWVKKNACKGVGNEWLNVKFVGAILTMLLFAWILTFL